ncbi:uncharacterized protein LOC143637084 [Bidens hawaiensis]|uniref:uncharacterized protein LOC143637084 n=1 Tax=Bidens hawaiensis TaxID=980011 RepID=UPI00404B6FC2
MSSPDSTNYTEIWDQLINESRRIHQIHREVAEEHLEVTNAVRAVANNMVSGAAPSTSPRRWSYILRDRKQANARLIKDYFIDTPTFNDAMFRRRFQMSKRLILRIVGDMEREYEYFQQKPDARGYLGFSAIQKCTSALRILAYGNMTYINDEYLKMAEKTTRDALENFCIGIIQLYSRRCLRIPTSNDLTHIYDVHESKHSFLGMSGSIDCMHWEWANCPTAWRGQYTCGDHEVPKVSLQAIFSHNLWIWSANFGSVGSNNDINVLNASPVLEYYISRSIHVLPFYANDTFYRHGYYLGDGMYPEYSIIVKTFQDPIEEKRDYFKKKQESARKDIERCFRVLKKRWHYVINPCRVWTLAKMSDAMYTCILLHNMILEDEGKAICQHYIPGSIPEQFPEPTQDQRTYNIHQLTSSDIHNQLKADLVQLVWDNRQVTAEEYYDLYSRTNYDEGIPFFTSKHFKEAKDRLQKDKEKIKGKGKESDTGTKTSDDGMFTHNKSKMNNIIDVLRYIE